jgi:uncharacterized RDD family membrane protein YckC
MRCPACGARNETLGERCPECGAIQEQIPVITSQTTAPTMSEHKSAPEPVKTEATAVPKARPSLPKTRSLLEFPGVNRNLPQWRKELGERVREVQERKAREAQVETADIGPLFSNIEGKSAPMLELLPQAELPPQNPLVIAALQRIERARAQVARSGGAATAVAYQEPMVEVAVGVAELEPEESLAKPERAHNLAVVPSPEPELIVEEVPAEPALTVTAKPRRVIDGQNDPALNYLDSIPRSVIVESHGFRSAPAWRRLSAAILDLTTISLLAAPFLALTELTSLAWQNPRVIFFTAGSLLVMAFFYLTVGVAFTGRTVGMKLLSLRVVDARTGLIPTGSQCVGRSLLYLLTIAPAGIGLLYAVINRDQRTIHDQFTRTVVVRA